MSGASTDHREHDDAPQPHLEVVVDESVNRALVGLAFDSLRLRVSVERVGGARASRQPDLLDAEVEAFLAERAPAHAHLPGDVAAVILQAELLNAFGVPRGDKSIAIFMHKAWTPSRAARHGAALAPVTLRHWRARLAGHETKGRRTRAAADPNEKAGDG